MDNKQFPEDFYPPEQAEEVPLFSGEESFLPPEEEPLGTLPDDIQEAPFTMEECPSEGEPDALPSEEEAAPLDQELMEVAQLLDEAPEASQEPETQPEPEAARPSKPAPERPVRKGRPRRRFSELFCRSRIEYPQRGLRYGGSGTGTAGMGAGG